MALSMPVLMLTIAGGIQIGRALVTRHRLDDATSYATRSAAIAGQTNSGSLKQIVQQRMGTEITRCAQLNVTAQVVAGAFQNGKALQVTSVCSLAPIFNGQNWSTLGPSTLTVIAAMPLDP
jgi:Flp pilus assembly protein TadG